MRQWLVRIGMVASPVPAVLALYGCGSLYDDRGRLAGRCVELAAPAVQWEAYAGAFHGFDGTGPVRLRRDVPNGTRPGQGVHVGGDPAARTAAAARLDQFIRDTWSLPR